MHAVPSVYLDFALSPVLPAWPALGLPSSALLPLNIHMVEDVTHFCGWHDA